MAGISVNAIALVHASLSTIVVVRNMEPLFTYTLERVLLGTNSPLVFSMRHAALVGLVVGAILHQHHALFEDDPQGDDGVESLYWALGCATVTSITRVWQSWIIPRVLSRMTNVDLVAWSNALCCAYMGTYLFVYSPKTLPTIATLDPPLAYGIALSCLPALGMAFGTVVLQARVSATQMAVLGCASEVTVAVFGVLVYRDSADVTSLVGLAVSLSSCGVYGCSPKREEFIAIPEDEEELENLQLG